MDDEPLRVMGFEFLSGEPGLMPASHRHKEVEVNLVTGGEMTYLLGGSRCLLPPGRLAVFWAMIPHRVIRRATGTQFFCIHLPLAWFLQWRLPEAFTHRLLHGEMLREGDPAWAARDQTAFEQWRQDLQEPTPETQKVLLLEIEARLRRLARSLAGPGSPRAEKSPRTPPASGEVSQVEAMASFITEGYQNPMTTGEIAAVVGLHPKYAMSLFRRHCGVTLGEYLTQQRLSQAQRLLATTDAKITDVAFESGFGSVSRFYAVFERVCGQSPRAYRLSLRGGG